MGSSQKPQKPSKPVLDASAPASESSPAEDVVVIYSPTEDGKGARVLRKRGDQLSVGEVRPLQEGRPIHGDVVRLEPRPEHPAVYDVRTEVATAPSAPERAHAGPARAASDQYRHGWESLWGRGQRRKNEKLN